MTVAENNAVLRNFLPSLISKCSKCESGAYLLFGLVDGVGRHGVVPADGVLDALLHLDAEGLVGGVVAHLLADGHVRRDDQEDGEKCERTVSHFDRGLFPLVEKCTENLALSL